MTGAQGDCCVVVVGAGAAGTLTATHLVTGLSRKYRVVLLDPSPTTGRGVAYSTSDSRHLLNVPASAMSAFPRDPEHFHRWVRQHHDPEAQPQDFVPRRVFGQYVESLLEAATQYPGNARLQRVHRSVTAIDRRGERFVVRTADGEPLHARAVVLAIGSRAGTGWAPEALTRGGGDAWVPDPWSADLPDEGDLLLVGTGLSMVDVAIAADRPGRTVHTVSRHDLLPQVHRARTTPAVPPPPGITRVTTLRELRAILRDHVRRTQETTGDWRAAVDGLRPVTSQLWAGLDEEAKRALLASDSRDWEVHRHRMPRATSRRLAAIADAGRLVRHRGTLVDAEPSPVGVRVTIGDATTREVLDVAAVVNCTGPDATVAADQLLSRLAHAGTVRPGPVGLGIATADDGRVLGVLPRSMPFFAIGALRRGNLWETTAMPEIREQAYEVATLVARALQGETRRRDGLALDARRLARLRTAGERSESH